jgi:sigma-B regulation protein RsbU (phosphoserine phosphatase)
MTPLLRVFLVDDEPPARARMRQLLADERDVLVVGEAADAIEARPAIAASRPDVVFVDVEMPQVSGTSLARSLPEPRPLVVFATAFDRYALDAFAVEAADYLVKPITRARLAVTLARLRERLSRRSDLERELAAASVAQAALLPRTIPVMPGLDAAALTLPARGVGGDFLVAERLSARRFILALGDVAGKGMPAGLVASSLQARIESVARHASGRAEDVIAEVNRTLCAASDGSRFATLAYLEIDPESCGVTLVNAGHLPLLLIDGSGTPHHFASTAPALGLLANAPFQAHRFTLAPETTLFVYSDGVTECFNTADEEFGEQQLLATLAGRAPTAGALCQQVVDAVRGHASGPATDDITVMAIRRGAETAEIES